MPTRVSSMPKDGTGFSPNFGFFSENLSSMEMRVKRLQTEQAWAEQPSSKTRHYVSNLLVNQLSDDVYQARSAFFVSRVRGELPYDFFSGERIDQLRRDGNSFKLKKRTILIDQTVLKSFNLSIFF